MLQKLGNMTPEMTVSPLYIRISRELLKYILIIFSIAKIINFDKINLGTIVLHKRALLHIISHIYAYVTKYFVSMTIAQHATR